MNGESDRWILQEEIPSSEPDIPDSAEITAKIAEKLWNNRAFKTRQIAEKFRYCRGCIYLRTCGSWFACTYLLKEDKKRPCSFGKDCEVRQYPDGYTVPKSHIAWCKKVDLEEDERARKANMKGGERKKRHQANWDTEYAKELYVRGFSVREICEIVGVKFNTLSSYMHHNHWASDIYGEKRRVFPKASKEVILAEREKFLNRTEENAQKGNLIKTSEA